jgi:hypothetical protein
MSNAIIAINANVRNAQNVIANVAALAIRGCAVVLPVSTSHTKPVSKFNKGRGFEEGYQVHDAVVQVVDFVGKLITGSTHPTATHQLHTLSGTTTLTTKMLSHLAWLMPMPALIPVKSSASQTQQGQDTDASWRQSSMRCQRYINN